jgi:hypothetical protein
VTDIDARLVVGEQWIIDPAYVTATDEAVGVGSFGVVRKGLLYGHVPVALKVSVLACCFRGILTHPKLSAACVPSDTSRIPVHAPPGPQPASPTLPPGLPCVDGSGVPGNPWLCCPQTLRAAGAG